MLSDDAKARRAFVNAENERLGRFLGPDPMGLVVGWRRRYQCECGFACTAPGDLFDHVKGCPGVASC